MKTEITRNDIQTMLHIKVNPYMLGHMSAVASIWDPEKEVDVVLAEGEAYGVLISTRNSSLKEEYDADVRLSKEGRQQLTPELQILVLNKLELALYDEMCKHEWPIEDASSFFNEEEDV